MAELNGTNQLIRGYEWGLQLIAARTFSPAAVSYYGFDGHGSVRYLTDDSGHTTDTYDFDAFGNLLSSTGTTQNNYLFAGEQLDPAMGIYYNRARYYDQRQGRFWTMDTYEGDPESPASLHKYLYAGNDPVSHVDPSGHESLIDTVQSLYISSVISLQANLGAIHVLVGVSLALAPIEIQNAFAIAFPEGQIVNAAAEIKELSLLRRAYELLGKPKVGSASGKFMAAVLPGALREFPVLNGLRQASNTLGSAVIDAFWNGIVFEFKTSIRAALGKSNQIEQLTKFAATQKGILTYIFLLKPDPMEVEKLALKIAEASNGTVRLATGYLFER